MKFYENRRTSVLIISIVLIALPIISLIAVTPGIQADGVMGNLDAWIEGSVENGELGMKVSCKTIKQPDGGDPQNLYFNGTTDGSGQFNITVDSNEWEAPWDDYSSYEVRIYPTYYKKTISGKDFFAFSEKIYVGNVTTIPPGSLSVLDFPTSNLTVKVYNKTSGLVLEAADVEISYDQSGMPEPPFSTLLTTDDNGEVSYPHVRSVNTSVEVRRENFRYLSNTEEHNYVIVNEGGDTHVSFDLIEKPWPFSVLIDSIDVNFTNSITIDFQRVMDRTTITDMSNFRLWEIEGDVDIPFTLTPRNNDQHVDIKPTEPLEFNTNYSLRIDTRLKEDGGSRPLWRAMTVTFTTELPPGMATGRIIDSVSSEPVEEITVRIVDQISMTGTDGVFNFPLIPAGSYRLDMDESYLYNGSSISGVKVEKGDMLDLGDVPIDPKPWGSLKVKVFSDEIPLEGAWVRIIDDFINEDDFKITTNSTGIAYFPRVLSNAVTLEVGAPHHNVRGDMAFVTEGGEGYIEFSLIEDPLPIWIEPIDKNQDETVIPTSDFLVHLSEAITFSTLNVSLWSTGSDGILLEEIPLTPPEKGDDDLTYIIDPMISLPLETSYMMVVSDDLLALDDQEPLIWKIYEFRFSTPDLPLIHINGTLLFEGQVIEGYTVAFGEFSASVREDGNFNITVDPDEVEEVDILLINGSLYGYASYENEFELDAGTILQVGIINLLHVPGWYTVDPPDGSENVEPDAKITCTFKESIIVPELDQIDRILSIIPEGSNAPINGNYLFSNVNKTVVFDPTDQLNPNTIYRIEISKDLMRWDNVSMFPFGNITEFKIIPPAIVITTIEPVDPISIPIDSAVRLGFNYMVNKQAVEQSLSLEPDISGITFIWVSSVELKIIGYMAPSTNYSLTLPGGVYGLEGEPILVDYIFTFSTGEGYGEDHLIGETQIFPSIENGWKTGENIKLSGIVENSVGYFVTAILSFGDEDVVTVTDTVGSDGSWDINFSLPNDEGSYKLIVTISMPDGPIADELEYTVSVGEVEGNGGSDDNSWIIIVIVIIVIVLLVIIIGAFLFTKRQKAIAEQEISRIEYTDVEGDWEEPEE